MAHGQVTQPRLPAGSEIKAGQLPPLVNKKNRMIDSAVNRQGDLWSRGWKTDAHRRVLSEVTSQGKDLNCRNSVVKS